MFKNYTPKYILENKIDFFASLLYSKHPLISFEKNKLYFEQATELYRSVINPT